MHSGTVVVVVVAVVVVVVVTVARQPSVKQENPFEVFNMNCVRLIYAQINIFTLI